MIARDAMLALDTQARLHIQHLSAGESVDVVRFAQKMGAKISAEVTPQHFSLTEQAVLEIGTNAKLNPPLRQTKDITKFGRVERQHYQCDCNRSCTTYP